MFLNNYQLYSVVSAKEKQNNEETQKILEIISKIDSLHKGDEVKNFLKKDLNIKSPIKNFPLIGKGTLNYCDYESTISIEIVYGNKHQFFCFEK